MDDLLTDPWLNALTSLMIVGSTVAWVYLIVRRLRAGDLLTWEPRHLVPWGPPAAILAVVLALMAVASAFEPSASAANGAHEPSGRDVILRILSMSVSQLLLSGGFFLVIARFYHANWHDCGLPRTLGEGLRDCGVGMITCLAALLPVRLVQGLSLWLVGRPDEISQHPLIETLTSHGRVDSSVLILACVSAVVVAPICEEVTFRLLLQGWLERWEHATTRLGQSSANLVLTPVEVTQGDGRAASEPVDLLAADRRELESWTDDLRADPEEDHALSSRGVVGLPYGWVPILASSLLFGIAHFGYGPEPVPLFFFGVLLGYVYQRTHRIVSCIVAHALFNLVSMLALWRIVVLSAEHVVP